MQAGWSEEWEEDAPRTLTAATQGRAASERAKVSEVDDGESMMKVGQCAKCEQALRAVVSCTGKERRAGEEHGTGQTGGRSAGHGDRCGVCLLSKSY